MAFGRLPFFSLVFAESVGFTHAYIRIVFRTCLSKAGLDRYRRLLAVLTAVLVCFLLVLFCWSFLVLLRTIQHPLFSFTFSRFRRRCLRRDLRRLGRTERVLQLSVYSPRQGVTLSGWSGEGSDLEMSRTATAARTHTCPGVTAAAAAAAAPPSACVFRREQGCVPPTAACTTYRNMRAERDAPTTTTTLLLFFSPLAPHGQTRGENSVGNRCHR